MYDPDVWFRYSDSCYDNGVIIRLELWSVTKHTKTGVWLDVGDPKFVARHWKKQFACPTIPQAQASYIARKKRQIGIKSAQLKRAEEALATFYRLNPDCVVT